ncbi:PREDICTED: zinc finger protein 629 [Drosophila arizonae]|uniref:Zinc finger protein 629 n=1 Tax=Drosophila arizonae TaxID=7263 RepID=A0ABM1PP83_DROAR|nr:PREDICTED: zinc finger protein 629 [Drosophila arizonae]
MDNPSNCNSVSNLLLVKTKQEQQSHPQQHQQKHSDDPHPTPQQSEQAYATTFFDASSDKHPQQPQSQSHPLLSKTISQGQQSPQHSITPSGGSSTPDIKYNNEKLANEIQLFMHKSAMQQIQQQIPRVGLSAHGVGTTASIGGSTTPGGSETKPHQCHQCMKSFSSNHQLVQHIRVHTGEKPYKCSYCDRRFKQLSHVQQHTRLHTGERPYKCHLPDCGRAFIQLSNLQQHLRNHDAQVERAKNRPFHCNICGKGFATESSLRTHTSKELQLHLGVLQQHAALIGGPNATSCPVCHKLFLGTEALMDHMKHVHKEKTSPPIEPPTQFGDAIHGSSSLAAQCASELSCAQPSNTSGSSLNDSYLGKRRTANHPCPVCGKHYVNEGSLRKHLACHAETSQLTSSLRMWPCSVCQAVFTHENGLLTHMDHMRMDPKHQFAAQYVLSRAAAEQRERESLLAASLATSSTSGARDPAGHLLPLDVGAGAGLVVGMGVTQGGGSNSLCPSPSVNSECSSSKINLAELRLPSSSQYHMDAELHANRMSLMAAASAAAAAVAASTGSRSQDGVTDGPGSAVVQAAVVNLAAAMRLNNPANHQQQPLSHLPLLSPLGSQQGHTGINLGTRRSPGINVPSLQMQSDTSASVMMSMMRGSLDSSLSSMHQMETLHHQHHQASNYSQHAVTPSSQQTPSHPQHPHNHHPETALRMHQQAEAILRSHTEAAFRLAASVAATNVTPSNPGGAGAPIKSESTIASVASTQQQQQHQRQINGSDLHASPHRFPTNTNQASHSTHPQSQHEQQPNQPNS